MHQSPLAFALLAAAVLPAVTGAPAVPGACVRLPQGDLEALAARCGSEIDWARDWSEARRRAWSEQRLVLVYARFYPGFQLSDEALAGPFMDPHVVELIAERYVPLRLHKGMSVPFADEKVYGLGPTTFGQAVLLVTHEGRVVREAIHLSYEFLLAGLDCEGAPAPPRAPRHADPIVRAAVHLRRGELERASELLRGRASASAHRLAASIAQRRRSGEEALALLDLARAAEGAEEIAVDLDADRALVLARLGRFGEAAEIYEGLLAEHPGHARAPEMLYHLGAIEQARAGRTRTEEIWHGLAREHPENRWAWKAAADLTSTRWSLGLPVRVEWLAEEVVARMRIPAFEPLPPSRVALAERDALAWLLAQQLEDGSWFSPTAAAGSRVDFPDDFQLAITAIGARALLAHRQDSAARAATDRAVAWLIDAYARVRAVPEGRWFMDYGVWSRAHMLQVFSDLVAEGLRGADELRGIAGQLVEDLARKQMSGGGWSYFVTGDLAGGGSLEYSISFTTAAVLLALLRARDAGFDLPADLLGSGLDCLEGMRNSDGTFEYMVLPGPAKPGRTIGAAGSAGRAPLCARALYLGGRGDLADIRAALAQFVRYRAALAAENGKSLLHTGREGQGSHYVLFDYAHAAAAIAELPSRERSRFRDPLLEVLLQARTEGGAFLDSEMHGTAFGTAAALQALHALRPRP